MTTKAIFNIDKKVKAAAMRKARREGTTLSAVLNYAVKAYAKDQMKVDVIGAIIDRAREDVRKGRVYTEKQMFEQFGIKE